MRIDKNWCMSSFLTFRYVADENRIFGEGISHKELMFVPEEDKYLCRTKEDIEKYIKILIKDNDFKKTAILLSGGIDSGILASYMPEGTVAYTVDSPAKVAKVEIERAQKVCKKYGLIHRVIEVTWEDYENSMDLLMKRDGCPNFANEPQVYTLAKRIKEDGFDKIIFGDNADMVFGGYDRLLSKDWTYDEWVERFTFVDPKKVLVNPISMSEIYDKYKVGDTGIDYLKFMNEIFATSSSGAYVNAFKCLNMEYIDPYAYMKLAEPLDISRIRRGDSKYLLRELYHERFPEFEIPEKIAMARAVDVWMADWEGPCREEFLNGCIQGMTGEQKYMIYCLERFLSLFGL